MQNCSKYSTIVFITANHVNPLIASTTLNHPLLIFTAVIAHYKTIGVIIIIRVSV